MKLEVVTDANGIPLGTTIAEPLTEPPIIGSPQTPLQKEFRKVRKALRELLEAQGLSAA